MFGFTPGLTKDDKARLRAGSQTFIHELGMFDLNENGYLSVERGPNYTLNAMNYAHDIGQRLLVEIQIIEGRDVHLRADDGNIANPLLALHQRPSSRKRGDNDLIGKRLHVYLNDSPWAFAVYKGTFIFGWLLFDKMGDHEEEECFLRPLLPTTFN